MVETAGPPRPGRTWRSIDARRLSGVARWAVHAAFFALLLWPFAGRARQSEVFVDETAFLSAGNEAVKRLRSGDLLSPDWTSNLWGQYGWVNPWLAKYLMGLGVWAAGYGDHTFKTVFDRGDEITPEILFAARVPSTLLGWGACILIYFIGRRIGVAVGAVAALYVAYNGFVGYVSSLAMLDAPCAFFALLAFWLLLRVADRLYAGAPLGVVLRAAAGVGVAAGCSISAKYVGGLSLLFAVALLVALACGHLAGAARLRTGAVSALAAAAVVGLAASLTFYVLNPNFYRHPLRHLRQTAAFWATRYANEGPELLVATRGEALRTTVRRVLIGSDTTKVLHRPLFRYFADRDHRWKNWFERVYVGSTWGFALVAYLAAAVGTIAGRWRRGSTAPPTDVEIHFFWSVFTCLAFALWLPAKFDRYFLLPFLTTPVLVAVGARDLATAPWRLLARRPAEPLIVDPGGASGSEGASSG